MGGMVMKVELTEFLQETSPDKMLNHSLRTTTTTIEYGMKVGNVPPAAKKALLDKYSKSELLEMMLFLNNAATETYTALHMMIPDEAKMQKFVKEACERHEAHHQLKIV